MVIGRVNFMNFITTVSSPFNPKYLTLQEVMYLLDMDIFAKLNRKQK